MLGREDGSEWYSIDLNPSTRRIELAYMHESIIEAVNPTPTPSITPTPSNTVSPPPTVTLTPYRPADADADAAADFDARPASHEYAGADGDTDVYTVNDPPLFESA